MRSLTKTERRLGKINEEVSDRQIFLIDTHPIIAIVIGCLVGLLLLPNILLGQGNPRINALQKSGTWVEGPEFVRKVDALKITPIPNIEGTRYYINEWLPGEVTLIDNVKTEKLELKMDALNNQVHFQVGENVLGMNSNNIREFHLENDGRVVKFKNGFEYSRSGISSNTFLRIIYDGDIKLLAHHTADIRESRSSLVATAGGVSGHFVHRTSFYLITPDMKIHKIRKLKRKHIMRELDKNRSEVEAFAEENNLDFRKEDDLVKILSYYDDMTMGS